MYIHNVNILERLCSFKYTSSSFQNLVQALSKVYISLLIRILEEYDAPTILLFKVSTQNNQHKDIPDQEEQSGVIGAFNFSLWKSDGFYHGNSGCYLFTLTPKFRVFLPSDTNSANSKNYAYLNASSSYNENIGIGMWILFFISIECFYSNWEEKEPLMIFSNSFKGFGGTIEHGFRLWIDGRDPSRCYARAEDDSYKKGQIVDSINGLIKVYYNVSILLNIRGWLCRSMGIRNRTCLFDRLELFGKVLIFLFNS